MVSRFRRTLSFPKPVISRPPQSFHVRSASLPCRSHPLLSQLTDDINDLKAWQSQEDPSSFWICDGLTRLKSLHDSFDDFLQLPKTQESLRHRSDWVEKLLEEFLHFVDAYGIFRALLVTFQEEHSLVQVAIRRRDESKVASCVRNQRNFTKEMKKLVSTITSSSYSAESLLAFDEDAELAGILQEINEITVSVTVTILNSISTTSLKNKSLCIGAKFLKRNKSCMSHKSEEVILEFQQIDYEKLSSLNKMKALQVRSLLKMFEELEKCVVDIEKESGRMFRSLLNTRVSLLNILTK